MKDHDDDGRVVMIGASFEEIATEAAIAVKREMDRQVEEVTPRLTQALKDGTAALNEANAALLAARGQISRYRTGLYVLVWLCAAEAGFLAMLILHH